MNATPGDSETPLFPRLLGDGFGQLPPTLQRLHLRQGTATWKGEVQVDRGSSWLARFCAFVTQLPPAGLGPITVEIIADARREQWTRHVAGHAMRSRLWASDGLLCERLGAVTFGFRLSVEDARIVWRVARVRALGIIPLPASAFGAVCAFEGEADGKYTFDVTAALPLVGPLVHYRGWLQVD